jgi:carbonic anhydrase
MSDADPYSTIALRQLNLLMPPHATLAEHQPQMLYFGCIDARLDPIGDIGIEKGKLLIFRNVAALVPKYKNAEGNPGGEALGAGAALEFFLKHIPFRPGKVKHVIISGHTDCGGLKACRDDACGHDHYLPLYLESLKEVRARVLKEAKAGSWDNARILHALEEESVRQSVANLLTYPVVQNAIDRQELKVHGWVLDTATYGISEMDLKTGEFERMAKRRPAT